MKITSIAYSVSLQSVKRDLVVVHRKDYHQAFVSISSSILVQRGLVFLNIVPYNKQTEALCLLSPVQGALLLPSFLSQMSALQMQSYLSLLSTGKNLPEGRRKLGG